MLTEGEMRTLVQASKDYPRHYTWTRTLLWLGLRPSELVAIRCADVDIENRILKICGSARIQDRFLEIPGCLLKDFYSETRGKKPEDFLFYGRDGKVHKRTIQKLFQKLKSQTGIEITSPIIRKTIAVRMDSYGVPIKEIGSYLGCKTLRAIYKLTGKSAKTTPQKLFSIEKIIDLET